MQSPRMSINPINRLLMVREVRVIDRDTVLVKAEGAPGEPVLPLSVHWHTFVGGDVPVVGTCLRITVEEALPEAQEPPLASYIP